MLFVLRVSLSLRCSFVWVQQVTLVSPSKFFGEKTTRRGQILLTARITLWSKPFQSWVEVDTS